MPSTYLALPNLILTMIILSSFCRAQKTPKKENFRKTLKAWDLNLYWSESKKLHLHCSCRSLQYPDQTLCPNISQGKGVTVIRRCTRVAGGKIVEVERVQARIEVSREICSKGKHGKYSDQIYRPLKHPDRNKSEYLGISGLPRRSWGSHSATEKAGMYLINSGWPRFRSWLHHS